MTRPLRVYPKNGSWYWVVPGSNRWVRLCRLTDGEARRDERLRIEQRRACQGDLQGAGDMPALVARYVAERASEHREKAWPSYGNYVREAFADVNADDVDQAYVVEFLRANWREKLPMQRVMRAFLSGFFRWCVEQRLMTANPCADLRLKKPKPRTTYITDEHFAAIRAAMLETTYARDGVEVTAEVPTGPMMQCFVDLCYLTFQRSTDVRMLRKSQVDRAAGVIHFVPSKTEDSSGVRVDFRITPEIDAVLARLDDIGVGSSKHVVHARDGTPYGATAVRSAWQRAAARAALDGFGYTVKDIRAKALTDADRAGHDMKALKIAAAHADERTTHIYLKQRTVPVSGIRMHLPE